MDFYIQYDENELLDARLSRLDSPADFKEWITDGKKAKKIQVKTITLDDFAIKEKLERLDFIKIDAEGYESVIVEGGLTVLKKFRPNLILECGGVYDSEEKRKRMVTRLRDLGYRLLGWPVMSGIVEVTWDQFINLSFPMNPERAVNLLFVQLPRT